MGGGDVVRGAVDELLYYKLENKWDGKQGRILRVKVFNVKEMQRNQKCAQC